MVRLREYTLKLQCVSKEFKGAQGALTVVEGFSLTVAPGEAVALMGPSGCGKTTLLHLAAGILKPTKGAVFWAHGLRIGCAFQEPRLLPWKTVEDNIRFAQDSFLAPEQGAEVRRRLLAQMGLEGFERAYPRELSGGMKQRVELARALAVVPQLLLLDEPFRSLDGALRDQLVAVLQAEQRRQGFAMLLVTHDPQEAVRLADRVLVLTERPAKVRGELVLATAPSGEATVEEIETLLEAAG